MTLTHQLRGIVSAVVTPLNKEGHPDLMNLQTHIQALGNEGCDGILLLGTTGEGPSMGVQERKAIIETGVSVAHGMTVYVGTGCPSLRDTIDLTRQAFELGADVAVILPPYYYKKISDDGLFEFFSCLFDEAVPEDKFVMLYDIPQISQIPLSFPLIERLLKSYEGRLAGVKDSTGDINHSRELCAKFPQLRIFVGMDRLLLKGLRFGAAGCITASANAFATLAIAVYRAYLSGEDAEALQERLTQVRALLDQYQPLAPTLKYLLMLRYGTPNWFVRPPLSPLPKNKQQELIASLLKLGLSDTIQWLKIDCLFSNSSL